MSPIQEFNARKKAWRAEGLCPECGSEPSIDRKFCEAHLLKARKRYRSAKRSGVCTCCKVAEPLPGSFRCLDCKVSTRRINRDRYRDRKAAGLCPKCGGKRSNDGCLWCAGCRARAN